MCTYTLDVQARNGEGKWKTRESYTVGVRMWWTQIAVCNCECLLGPENQSSGVKQQLPFLVDTSRLLLGHSQCIFFQPSRLVCFLNWPPIKSESDLPHWQALSLVIGFPWFGKCCMPLTLTALWNPFAGHPQINVMVILSLDSFLGLFLGHGEHGVSSAAASQKGD